MKGHVPGGKRVRRIQRGERPRIYLVLTLYVVVGLAAAALPAVSTLPAAVLPAVPAPPLVPAPLPLVTEGRAVSATRPYPHPVVLSEIAGPVGDRTVALTFDDGPDPTWTPQVLRLLREHGATATFCMVGARVVEYPELVHEVVAAGMRLCDHTRTHDLRLATRPHSRIVEEIAGTRADLLAVTQAPVDYFRAPGGNWAPNVAQCAVEHGMQPLGWSVDPKDWSEPGTAAIVAYVQQHVHPGAVILLHDGGARRGQTVAALAELLPWLAAQGYEFGYPTA